MRQLKNKKVLHVALAAFMAVSGLSSLVLVQKAHAATVMAQTYVRLDRMAANTFTSGTVCAMPSAAGPTEAKVKVTFPTGFTVSTTTSNWTVNTTNTGSANWPAGAVAWPSIATATAASGQDVTFPSGDLTSASTLYCFNWTDTTAALKTPASPGNSLAGSVTTQTSAPADIDSGSFSTAVISNDQIAVTATVPVAFSFALSGNSDSIGSLTTANPSTGATPQYAQVDTNAKNGWVVWAKDANAGLHSTNASYTIPTTCSGGVSGLAAALTAGNEGFNTGVTTSQVGGSGAITRNSLFDNSSATTYNGGGLCTTYQYMAKSNGSAQQARVTLTNNASIKASTPSATDYTDTITVVGAGLF